MPSPELHASNTFGSGAPPPDVDLDLERLRALCGGSYGSVERVGGCVAGALFQARDLTANDLVSLIVIRSAPAPDVLAQIGPAVDSVIPPAHAGSSGRGGWTSGMASPCAWRRSCAGRPSPTSSRRRSRRASRACTRSSLRPLRRSTTPPRTGCCTAASRQPDVTLDASGQVRVANFGLTTVAAVLSGSP